KPDFAAQKAKLETYAAQVLRLAGWPDADGAAKSIVDFQTKIAEASWTKTQQRDPAATYNPMRIAELDKHAPGFDWKAFLGAVDLGKVQRPIIAEKSAFPKLAAIFAATPVATLQADLAFGVLDNSGPYLSKPFVDAWFDMHGRMLSGQQTLRVRWKR